jgi:glucose/arabinose dehydrogenase
MLNPPFYAQRSGSPATGLINRRAKPCAGNFRDDPALTVRRICSEVPYGVVGDLASPFGVALVGSDLYIANTDAIVRYPYKPGDTKIVVAGMRLTPLPGGPIDHHWTKSLVANRDGSLLYVGVGSNSNITENGLEAEKNRAAIWEVDRATGRWRLFACGSATRTG